MTQTIHLATFFSNNLAKVPIILTLVFPSFSSDSEDDMSDMDRLLQTIADRCCEPVVLESIYNYYATTKQSVWPVWWWWWCHWYVWVDTHTNKTSMLSEVLSMPTLSPISRLDMMSSLLLEAYFTASKPKMGVFCRDFIFYMCVLSFKSWSWIECIVCTPFLGSNYQGTVFLLYIRVNSNVTCS